eukprot:6191967-Pleurochrysis_carterae.AAC.1
MVVEVKEERKDAGCMEEEYEVEKKKEAMERVKNMYTKNTCMFIACDTHASLICKHNSECYNCVGRSRPTVQAKCLGREEHAVTPYI